MYTTTYVHCTVSIDPKKPGRASHRLARAKIGQSKSLWVSQDTSVVLHRRLLFDRRSPFLWQSVTQC